MEPREEIIYPDMIELWSSSFGITWKYWGYKFISFLEGAFGNGDIILCLEPEKTEMIRGYLLIHGLDIPVHTVSRIEDIAEYPAQLGYVIYTTFNPKLGFRDNLDSFLPNIALL